MSLRVLIVGRGDGPVAEVPNGHRIEFRNYAIENSKATGLFLEIGAVDDMMKLQLEKAAFASIDNYEFIVQHLSSSNPEGPAAINHWEANGHKHRLLGLAGEVLPDAYAGLGIPCIENCNGRDGIIKLAWEHVPANFNGTAAELQRLLTTTEVFLPALSILCQGYLAVMDCVSANKFGHLSSRVEVPKRVEDLEWWRAVIKLDAVELEKEWPEPRGQESEPDRVAVLKLIEWIHEPSSGETLVSLVLAANKAITTRRFGNPPV